MECFASVRHRNLRLTVCADPTNQRATVRVVVQNVITRPDFTTWRHIEANRDDEPCLAEWEHIRELSGFEPHDALLTIGHILIKNASVHRSKLILVRIARIHQFGVLGWITGERLVKWIKSDHIGVIG